MKSVLLYSGGLDSYIYNYLLKPDICLYVDINSKYTQSEKHNITQINTLSNLKIVQSKDMRYLEQPNAIIKNRNIYLILEACNFGENIYLGSTIGDGSKDKDKTFFQSISALLTHTSNKKICVTAPFIKYSKSELIKKYIEKNGDITKLKNIFSCYTGEKKQCGKCKACVRNAIAFKLNNIDTRDLYNFDIFQRKDIFIEYSNKIKIS